MDILLIVVVCFSVWLWGIYIGWQAREEYAKRQVEKFLDSKLEEQVKEVKTKHLPIKIEEHNGAYYVYGLDNNEFMAQGQTRWHLEQALEKRYPGKKFAATAENLREVGFEHVPNSK